MEDIMGAFGAITGLGKVATFGLTGAGVGGLLSLASRNLVSSFGQNLIQKLGTAMGLPQPIIDAAQGAFAAASGDPMGAARNAFEAGQGFAGAVGRGISDAADYGRDFDNAITRMAADIAGGDEFRSAKSGGKGGSWLMAMARALGAKADKLASQMEDLASKMSSENSKPSDSMAFSAKSQEFGLFMNAASNALKTAGESLTTVARKGG
jgi:hypothetical protein